VFELAEAALDEVTFLVDGFVEVEFCGPRGIAGDNGGGAGLGEGDAEVVGIVSGIGQDEAWSILVEQSSSLWGIAALRRSGRPGRGSRGRGRRDGSWCSSRHASGREPDLQPLFCPGGMPVGADDGAVEDQVFEVRVPGHDGEDAMPDALGAPAAETAEGAVPVPEGVRQAAYGLSPGVG
jgi:hypothetical protein